MFESGLFGQGNAFWRWIATDEARPYLTAFAVDRAPPSGSEFFAAELSAEDLLDSEHLPELAQKIETATGYTTTGARQLTDPSTTAAVRSSSITPRPTPRSRTPSGYPHISTAPMTS